MTYPELKLVALEVTRSCPLSCRHCRGDSLSGEYENELTLSEIENLFENISTFATPIIIITGGEALTRPDIFEIARNSSSRGFRTVLATCGQLLDDKTALKLIENGVSRISISLDGASAEKHDSFRRVPGAFASAVKAMDTARRNGLEFQVNSTITVLNISEIETLYSLSVEKGASGFHPFLLVPMGRGAALKDIALSPEEYEKALVEIAGIAAESPIEIKPTCAPHYSRVIRQTGNAAALKNAHGHALTAPSNAHVKGKSPRFGGCIGGKHFAFVSHRGKVQLCGFLEAEAGDLRENGMDFKSVWENSGLFVKIRDVDSYKGKCGVCGYRFLCGGCRARAYYLNGDFTAEEPDCIHLPHINDNLDIHHSKP